MICTLLCMSACGVRVCVAMERVERLRWDWAKKERKEKGERRKAKEKGKARTKGEGRERGERKNQTEPRSEIAMPDKVIINPPQSSRLHSTAPSTTTITRARVRVCK